MINAAAVVAPLPHPMMDTFFVSNEVRTASTSSAISSVPMLVSLPTGMTASIAPRGAIEMTLNFVMAVPNVSGAFSDNVRASGPYSRSGNNSNVRGDEPDVALRRYKDSENVLLLLSSLVMGTRIFPHSIGPHGSQVISLVVISARAGDVGKTVTTTAAAHRKANAERRTVIC